MSASVATPRKVRSPAEQAFDALRAAAERQDVARATTWYRITRERACEHPKQSLERVHEDGITLCRCTACNHSFKEVA